ncbi:MAG: hypothetical protein A2505_08685 [Deltaproteobacteria bacterium RIFOXYD12_FULL_55_16]|nr:MAG: hypothetical protein A2505_08685 [Deltaproteobacteria bacterium RIFOXYD12_FULL_55_16]
MKKKWGILLVFLFLATGCSTMTKSRSFIHPESDFSFYQKVGVLPFTNQAEDRFAGEKLIENFITELLIWGNLAVMDTGQLNGVVAQVAKISGPGVSQELSPTHLGQIAQVAGVQGLFMGTVHDYKMIQLGGEQYPMISMTLKFIDAPTGTIVWQNTVSAVGGPNLPIVSIGESFTLGQLSQKICKDMASNFFESAYPKSFFDVLEGLK